MDLQQNFITILDEPHNFLNFQGLIVVLQNKKLIYSLFFSLSLPSLTNCLYFKTHHHVIKGWEIPSKRFFQNTQQRSPFLSAFSLESTHRLSPSISKPSNPRCKR